VKTKINKRLTVLIIVLVAVTTAGLLIRSQQTHPSNQGIGSQSSSQEGVHNEQSSITTPASSQTSTPGAGAATTQSPKNAAASVSNPSHPQSSTLAKPTGQLYNTNPVKRTDTVESTCQTVFGAKCGLQLTGSSGTIVTVTPINVDNSGSTLIEWKPSSYGVADGTWKVQLLATKDGQSSLSDAYNLTINQ
jgi:activator of HSP90 ATPase